MNTLVRSHQPITPHDGSQWSGKSASILLTCFGLGTKRFDLQLCVYCTKRISDMDLKRCIVINMSPVVANVWPLFPHIILYAFCTTMGQCMLCILMDYQRISVTMSKNKNENKAADIFIGVDKCYGLMYSYLYNPLRFFQICFCHW